MHVCFPALRVQLKIEHRHWDGRHTTYQHLTRTSLKQTRPRQPWIHIRVCLPSSHRSRWRRSGCQHCRYSKSKSDAAAHVQAQRRGLDLRPQASQVATSPGAAMPSESSRRLKLLARQKNSCPWLGKKSIRLGPQAGIDPSDRSIQLRTGRKGGSTGGAQCVT